MKDQARGWQEPAAASFCVEKGLSNPVSMKELRLDFVATLLQAIDGHGHAHYGYWPGGMPETPSLQALSAAQRAYFDLLAAKIPHGTRTILDVGSGTGANALGLTEQGFELECLCPSEHLNSLACGKLPETVQVHDCMFEDYNSDRRFDLCMFAESFHYIILNKALAKLDQFAEKHVLIFDFFRRDPEADRNSSRGTHAKFRRAVEEQGVFRVVSDEDLTQAILPTFVMLDHMRTELLGPFVARARKTLASAYPLRAHLVEWLFGRKLDKIGQLGGRAERIPDKFEYRLILMERR